jgi:multiple sugar transport system substrate-binding protein
MTRRDVLAWLAAAGCSVGCRGALDGRTTVRLANWGGASDDSEFPRLVRRLYDEFERSHPGIRLQVEKIPGSQDYATKLVFSHISRSMPEVPTLDASSAAVFVEHGILADVSPRLAASGEVASGDYWPNVMGMFSRGPRLYAVPVDFTPVVLYYNRAHFREAGIEPEARAWSFDEFLDAAKELARPGRYSFEFPNWIPGWIPWLWNAGGDVLTPDGARATGAFDSEASEFAVQFLADLVLRHKLAPALSEMAAAGADFFASGRASMQMSGHWELVGLQSATGIAMEDIGVMPVPGLAAGSSRTVMYGAGLALAAETKAPDEAWQFIEYFTSRAVQEQYNASGIAVCGRMDVAALSVDKRPRYAVPEGGTRAATDAEYAAHRVREQAFLDIVPSARPPWGASVVAYAAVEQEGQRMMDKVLRNGVAPRQALRESALEIDRLVAR